MKKRVSKVDDWTGEELNENENVHRRGAVCVVVCKKWVE